MEGINHILLPGGYALGTRTNVDDDKAPLKAHLHTHTSPGTYFQKRQTNHINQARHFAYYLLIFLFLSHFFGRFSIKVFIWFREGIAFYQDFGV